MTTKRKQFIVRGFDPLTEQQFDSRGPINKFGSYVEARFDNQHLASVAILRGDLVDSLLNGQGRHLDEVKLRIETDISDPKVFKQVRKELLSVIQTWAEKCRLRGARGYRVSAVRELNWDRNEAGEYVVTTTVLLGDHVVYDYALAKSNVTADVNEFKRDLLSLQRALRDHGVRTFTRAKHSSFGTVEAA